MDQPPDLPSRPEHPASWVDSSGQDHVLAAAPSIAGGDVASWRARFDPPEPDPILLPEPPDQPRSLTVHVSLDESEPLVWRRLRVPGEIRLVDLHAVIQTAMGWTDSHLHRFFLDDPWRGPHFVTDYDDEEGGSGVHEIDARLDQVLREPGQTLGYVYDYGDSWVHTLRLEQAAAVPPGAGDERRADGGPAYRIGCLAGAGACPPEDVGGMWGYEEMATWVRHDYAVEYAPPSHGDDLDHLRQWLPPGWHPDVFDAAAVDEALAGVTLTDPGGALTQLPSELRLLVAMVPPERRADVDGWLASDEWAKPTGFTPEDAAVLTTPLRTVLDVVGEGITLTKAGNLPPASVLAIYTALRMDRHWIGAGNREDLTPPVAELREQARALGLIRKNKGRLLPTARGRAMHADAAALLRHVYEHLTPPGDQFSRLATQLSLLALVGGVGPVRTYADYAVDDAVCRVLAAVGWRTGAGPIDRYDVRSGKSDLMGMLRSMTDGVADPQASADLQRRLALALLRGATAAHWTS